MDAARPSDAVDRPEPARRAAAVVALGLVATALVVSIVGLIGDLGRVLSVPVLFLMATALTWISVTRRGATRLLAAGAAVVVVGLAVAIVLTGEGGGWLLLVVLVLLAASTVLVRYALRRDRQTLRSQAVPGLPVDPATRGVLIMNLRSGGGKAERFDLVGQCRRRGIEPVVLQPGDDLIEVARAAIDRGADVLGMAGGDGSLALVASVAMAADVPLVCVPAGTRNHFALDLGLDRDDVVAALGAFDAAVERRIDLAEVNGRVFVNNVSLGVYAKIVHRPEYRDAKRHTTAEVLAELFGPGADPFELYLVAPDGSRRAGSQMIQISNNPYLLASLAGFGSRARLDTGLLGVAAAKIRGAGDVAAFVAAELSGRLDRFRGWTEWTAKDLRVEAAGPVEAGVDGEALLLDPPLQFRILPGALRVRVPPSAPGYSPASLKAPSPWWTLVALLGVAAGRASQPPTAT